MVKKIGIAFVFSFLVVFSWAQMPGGMNIKGHVWGKVVDEKGAGIPMTNVLVLESKFDSTLNRNRNFVLKSTVTENNGDFMLEDVPFSNQLILKVANFEYTTQEIPFKFDRSATGIAKDFGKITMKEEQSEELKEVQITAIQSTMQLDVDKKVFMVGQNAMSDGGTAVDVMKNVPGIDVDIEGNINLRNSSPILFIDGRPTTLTLDQIPAESIESVEVITNPSAKYDASGGGAGIINIVLKKNKRSGYNGGVRAGMDSYLGANLGADINVRQNKWNVSLSLNGRRHAGVTDGDVTRNNFANSLLQTTMTQDNIDKRFGAGFFGKLGIDYLMTNRTTLSLSTNLWAGSHNNKGNSDIYTDSVASGGTSPYFSDRITDNKRSMVNYGVNFGMKHLFQKQGEEWTLDATYNSGNYSTNSLYQSDYFQSDINSSILRQTFQKTEGSGSDNNLVLQTDYVRPLKIFKLETGLRAAMRQRKTITDNYYKYHEQGDYQLVNNPASNYDYSDNVFAAYVSASNKIKKFGYKVGLRAESSTYRGKLLMTGEKFSNTYPISLFPSVFLTQQLNKDQDLQLSYTRRINRPSFFELIPFVDSVDVFNMNRGNPDLHPEFVQSFELQYMKRFKNRNTLLGSAYYKYTNNLITRYIEQADNGALINTFVNANSSYAAGLELTSQNYISKWLEINTNVNIYNSKINDDDTTKTFNDAMWSWFAKMNLNFKLPKSFTIQLSGLYQSKSNVPANSDRNMGWMPMAQTSSQGYIKAYYAVDLAVKKAFMNNRMFVTLSISDIFASRKNVTYTESTFFTQDYSRLSNPRMVRLNFMWTFGKVDTLLFKRLSKGTGESVIE